MSTSRYGCLKHLSVKIRAGLHILYCQYQIMGNEKTYRHSACEYQYHNITNIHWTTSVIYLIWIDGKSILLDRIKEYKVKIKGVSLHSLQISTTQIIIAFVNVVNNFYCQSSSLVMNRMPNLLISIHFVSWEASNLFLNSNHLWQYSCRHKSTTWNFCRIWNVSYCHAPTLAVVNNLDGY